MSNPINPAVRSLVFSFCALLTACGGSQSGSHDEKSGSGVEASDAESKPASEEAALARAAALNTASLAAAEKRAQAAEGRAASTNLNDLQPGQIAPKSAYASGDIARKALVFGITAYRFYNTSTGAHFYTVSATEREHVRNNLSPPFNYEGEAFQVANAYAPGLSPVHRFYNTQNGVHFYTISETERAYVLANLPHYTYEGVAYHASEVAGNHLIPFHRFYVPSRGFHFYTASEEEKNSIIANLGATYRYEGIGYYVLDASWSAEKLPHTGVTTCYRAGSNLLQPCAQLETEALNHSQDGHVVRHQAYRGQMAYAQVPGPNGTFFPKSHCTLDRVTGLVWEAKLAQPEHLRDRNRLYSYQGNGNATDVSVHVAAINAERLCGFNDWRVPTRMELQSLVDYGSQQLLKPEGFDFYALSPHWTSDITAGGLARWTLAFNEGGGWSVPAGAADLRVVRLVRGTPLDKARPRFSFTTEPYPGDAANNVVTDAWSGLQWRRCEEGRTWNGVTCTGTASIGSHETALVSASQKNGWRLPNVKELSSLPELSVNLPARIDPVAFPDALPTFLWTSTPYETDTGYAWIVRFDNGGAGVDGYPRIGGDPAVRLVRNSYPTNL
jgi:hypothetical protein